MSITKLDAINTCLGGISLAPVDTEDSTDLDAATASRVIDRVSHSIQSKGWFFNKESNWKLTPDSITGYISAPSSAISIITTGVSRSEGLSIRGDLIYDLYNHTYDLSSRVSTVNGVDYLEFTFITELPFSLLPPVAKQAIMYRARREFAQDLEVDERRWKFQSNDEGDAHDSLLREDARNKKRNSLTGNTTNANFIAMVAGRNSLSLGSATFPKRDN